MGLGPIAGIDSMLLPAVRKAEQTAPRFEIEATPRAGDDPSSSQQQASDREHREPKEDAGGDLFQATADDNGDVEALTQISEEGHDWFV
jgi:hypothetical protein